MDRWLLPLLAALLVVLAVSPGRAEVTIEQLFDAHQALGRTLDEGYYAAGSRVDIVLFDLAELDRQGRQVPTDLWSTAREADRELRHDFVQIDQARAAIDAQVVDLPPAGDFVLKFEVTADSDSGGSWFGVADIRIVFPSGEQIDLPLTDMQGGAFRRKYSWLVPPRDAVFIYSRPSPTHSMQVGFEAPEETGTGEGELVLTGLDAKAAGQTSIAVHFNGVEIFRGRPDFSDEVWVERNFKIPQAALLAAAPPDRGKAERLLAQLEDLRDRVDRFVEVAKAKADQVEAATASLRDGLEYRPLPIQEDFWRSNFVRGICVSLYTQDEEHHAKWLHSLGVNLVYSYAGRYSPLDELPELLRWTEQLGLPVFQNPPMLTHKSREALRLGDADTLAEEVVAYLKDAAGDTGVRLDVAVDEPNFRDELAEQVPVQNAFKRYLDARRPLLEAAGIVVPEVIAELPPAQGGGDKQAIWMEWQLFRRQFLAEHFQQFWEQLRAAGVTPFTIIQFHFEREPQLASYSTMGQALPLISTDIYRDGGTVEAVGVQLLQHASKGTAVYCAGSGYSARSPDSLARSMATAMIHADGLLEWTDLHLSKYRDPKKYWRVRADDRGRSVLANWDPDYWKVTRDMYERMRVAAPFLGHADSRAKVAVLLSERTLIASGASERKPLFDRVHSTYANLVRRGIPLDVRLVESTPVEALETYDVVLLPDARVLAPDEEAALAGYVRSGGTLIVAGATASRDPWGRPRSQPGIEGILGVRYNTDAADPAVPRWRVTPSNGAHVLGTFDDGSPALVKHAVGQGHVFYTATTHPTAPELIRVGRTGERRQLDQVIREVIATNASPREVSLLRSDLNTELQIREKEGQLIVHVLKWAEDDQRDYVEVQLRSPTTWRVFDPTRPDRPAMDVEEGRVRIPLVYGHGMAVMESASSLHLD